MSNGHTTQFSIQQLVFPHSTDELPPTSHDNHKFSQPLTVLQSKSGLSPDDSRWEKWDHLCVSFQFEDRVDYARVGIEKEAVDGWASQHQNQSQLE